MDKQSLGNFLEAKIDKAAQNICNLKDRQDHFAYGQLQVFLSLRRALNATRTDADRGLIDAMDDVLLELGMIAQSGELRKRFA
ncbi:hypothetical protein [Pseudomonas sp. JR33AA]|uniref:hypothetical protein n=1 Tax=Pseudomonas sp. JR33AA TaxID=2899113 RepID=UPI001F1E1052|nr:hypothetical protein [Pseudomonas sp. JR33AA]MCE5975418.1 hypothetical protein [Pseudomonas sp. JR33AA]